MSKRATASFAGSYERHSKKRQLMYLPLNHAPLPERPAEQIGRVDSQEHEVLLHLVMQLLLSLPGAERGSVSGRDAVLYNGIAFVDTHTLPYLKSNAPDVTFVRNGAVISAGTDLALLELQVGTWYIAWPEIHSAVGW
jgi:hypothetical protein